MKQYLKMVLFIFVLGAVSAGLLIGVDALTRDRIEQNKTFELYSAILEANDEKYTANDFVEVFNSKFEKMEPLDKTTNIVVYQHKENKNVSFQFQGNGMWGPIKGVITLEEDFKTIVNIKILDQEETPGLGARIGEDEFLRRFVGKQFPNINIIKDRVSDKSNEILGLTGATTTTGKLQGVLNTEFMNAYRAYKGDDLDLGAELEIFVKLLAVHGVTADETTVIGLLDETFDVLEDGNLKLYIDNNNGLVSFIVKKDIRFAENGSTSETIPIIITLEKDKQTVNNIVAVYQDSDGHWGKAQLLQDLNARGAKFPNVDVSPNAGAGDIAGGTGVTATRNDFKTAINAAYDEHLPLLNNAVITGGSFAEEFKITLEDIEQAVLRAIGKANSDFDNTVYTLIEGELYVDAKQELVTYVIEMKLHFGYDNEVLEDVAILVTLKNDFKTIHSIDVLYENNDDHLAKEVLFDKMYLNNALNVIFVNNKIKLVSEGGANNEIILSNSDLTKFVLETRDEFQGGINLGYSRHKGLIHDIDFDTLLTTLVVLKDHGYDTNVALSELYSLYNNVMDEFVGTYDGTDYHIVINKETGKTTLLATENLVFGRNGAANDDVYIYLTLDSDFKTIANLTVIHDENRGHWGKRDLFVAEVLANAIGKKFPDVDFSSVIDEKDAFLGVTGVTLTGQDFNDALNNVYDYYVEVLVEELNIDVEMLGVARIVLGSQGYDLNISIELVVPLFNQEIKIVTNNIDGKDYTLYVNKNNNKVTIESTNNLVFGRLGAANDDVIVYLTLASDYETILNLVVSHDENRGHWGKRDLLIDEVLVKIVGRSFPNLNIASVIDEKDAFLGVTGVTLTGIEFSDALNEIYNDTHDLVLDQFEFVDYDGKSFVVSYESGNVTFIFSEVLTYGNKGPIQDLTTFYVTLEDDFETIVDVSVAYSYPEITQWGKERLLINSILNALNGLNMNDVEIEKDNKFLGVTGVTLTGRGFETALKDNYLIYKTAYEGGNN